jgi:glycosyltransferase involved in cell wall biosynthesis
MKPATLVRGDALAADAAAAAPADVLVLAPGAHLAEDGVARLRAAAERDATIATVSAIAPGDGEVSRGGADAAALVAARALGLRPRIAAPALDCLYVTRAALDIAGPLDEGFAARCSAYGLVHVVADDVLVRGVPATRADDPLDEAGGRGDLPPRPPAPLKRALTWTRRVLDGLDVTVDGRVLGSLKSGTEVQALALIAALRATGEARVRVLLAPDPPTAVREALGDVDIVLPDELDPARRSAIVHRPFQVSGAGDLEVLAQAGERLVVTHQDLILFHAPSYHARRDLWVGYRRLTGSALAAADMVVAISEHVRQDLLAEDLADPARLRLVHQGVDHGLADAAGPASPPAGLTADTPFLVCLGSDLKHKQRPFAIALVRELRALGWPGRLVLAGPAVAHGSSRTQEQELLATDPGLAVTLDAVSDDERRWLYREAAAVLYPSLTEGFGLVPFEAAAAGTPVLLAPVSALAETLPPELALLHPWDARVSAGRSLGLLTDRAQADRHVAAVRAAGERFTWDRTARALLTTYDETLALPARPGAEAAFQALAAEDRRGHWEGSYHALRNQIGPVLYEMTSSEDELLDQLERVLGRLARHPRLRRTLTSSLRGARKVLR